MNDDVLYETLERMDLHPRRTNNGWSIRCPKHEDRHNSAQCFPDGWIQCYAGCGRFHINKVVGHTIVDGNTPVDYERQKKEEVKPVETPIKAKEEAKPVETPAKAKEEVKPVETPATPKKTNSNTRKTNKGKNNKKNKK